MIINKSVFFCSEFNFGNIVMGTSSTCLHLQLCICVLKVNNIASLLMLDIFNQGARSIQRCFVISGSYEREILFGVRFL